MALQEFNDRIEQWVSEIIRSPKNLASETELREQAKISLRHFLEADADHNESLSFSELKFICSQLGLPMSNNEEEALAKIDADGTGTLDIEEWTRWWLGRISSMPNPAKQQEAIARNTFRKMDTDSSGYLDIDELGHLLSLLGADFTDEEMHEARQEIDSDSSGVIDQQEFVAWWINRAQSSRGSSSIVSLKLRRLAAKAAEVFNSDIFTAVWQGDEELVRAFVQSEPRLVHASDESEFGAGFRALHYASYRGNCNIATILLDAGAQVNALNDCGFSPFLYAAQREHIDMCRLLLDRGADPFCCAQIGDSGRSLCATEFAADSKPLRALLREQEKCTPPRALCSNDIRASLSIKSGALRIQFNTSAKSLSALPVVKWKFQLSMENAADATASSSSSMKLPAPLTLTVRAATMSSGHGGQQTLQPLELTIDKSFVVALLQMRTRGLLRSLRCDDPSHNGIAMLWSQLRAIYEQADDAFKRRHPAHEVLRDALARSPEDGSALAIRHAFFQHLDKCMEGGVSGLDPVDEAVKSFLVAASSTSRSPSAKLLNKMPSSATTAEAKISDEAQQTLRSICREVESSVVLWLRIAPDVVVFDAELSEELAVDLHFPQLS